MTLLVAVLAATAAAWWPGRAVARVPVTLALSARPPRPKPAHHSAIVAVVLIAAGIGSLVLSNRNSAPLIVAGIVATILGTLLLGPLAIRLLARRGRPRPDRRAPGATRPRPLPGPLRGRTRRHHARPRHRRDGRHPRRGRGEEGSRRASQPLQPADPRVHRSTRDPEQIAIQTPAELDRMAPRVRQLAADLDDAAVVPLSNAILTARKVRHRRRPASPSHEVLVRKIDDPDNWRGRSFICAAP